MASLVVNYSKYCRICRKKARAMVDIFYTRENGISLAEKISQCTQLAIKLGDDRPANICKTCTNNLNNAYDFWELAKKSDLEFQHIVLLQPTNINESNDDETLHKNEQPFEIIDCQRDAYFHEEIELKSEMGDTSFDVYMTEQQKLESSECTEFQIKDYTEEPQQKETIEVSEKRQKLPKQSKSSKSKTKVSAIKYPQTHAMEPNASKLMESNASETTSIDGLADRKTDVAYERDLRHDTFKTKISVKKHKSSYSNSDVFHATMHAEFIRVSVLISSNPETKVSDLPSKSEKSVDAFSKSQTR